MMPKQTSMSLTTDPAIKKIRLNCLSLRDFQGGTMSIDFQGRDTSIYAANAGGKTRLVSAFNWLLFSKDALGRAEFEIKNLDAQGEVAHGLEHSVEVGLDMNGQPITLKKVYSEKWTKRRGSANREFAGHTTQYYIDGIPVQEKEYLARIIEIAGDESRFRLLTNPIAFPSLPALPTLKDPTRNQRSILFEVCSDISDADVIASDPKLSPLPGILGKRSLDDHRKIIIARRIEINKEMQTIPVRIDEVHRGLPDVTGIDRQTSEKEAQRLDTALNDAKLRLQGTNTGGAIADLTKKLAGFNADLQKMENTHRSGSLITLNRLNQQISEVEAKVNGSRRRLAIIEGDLKAKDGTLQATEVDLTRLRKQWMAVNAEEFPKKTETLIAETCYACGQSLPAEKVEESRDKVQEVQKKALADFNQNKAEHLKMIDDKGMDVKDREERLRGEIKALKVEQDALAQGLSVLDLELKQVVKDRDTLKCSSQDFSGVDGWADIFDEIERVEILIKEEKEGKAEEVKELEDDVKGHGALLQAAKGKVEAFVRREQGEKRIEELKAEEKKLSKEFEKLEGELYLCDLFVRQKVSMLTDNINSKFEFTRFRLFTELINGGIEPTCEITVNGVGYNSGLNAAAKTQAGMDIIRTLQRHYGIHCPIFIDNRESCTEVPKMGCQVVSLYVSSEDKQLRIEIEKKEAHREAA